MTKERFVEILRGNGFSQIEADSLWEKNGGNPNLTENNVKFVATIAAMIETMEIIDEMLS